MAKILKSHFIVTYSMIKTWRRCRRAYWYKYVRNLSKRKAPLPMLRGTFLHECIDSLHKTNKIQPVVDKFKAQYGRMFREERETYGDLIPEVIGIMQSYRAQYKNDGLKYDNRTEVRVATEINSYLILQGDIDAIPEDPEGRFWVMDHKSHKNLPDEEARFSDYQLVTYCWLLPRSKLKIKPQGVVWDYIRTKPPAVPPLLKNGELSQRKNIDTTYGTYLKAITDNGLDPGRYQAILSKLKDQPNKFFQRIWLPTPNRTMVDTLVNDLIQSGEEIRQFGGRDLTRSLSRDCKQCTFYTLCHAELRGFDTTLTLKHDYEVQKEGGELGKNTEDIY